MNLERLPEKNLEKGLTIYGDRLTLFGEMVEVSHRQTPRKDCDAKAPRQDSTISGFRLGIALPNDRAAASQGSEAAVSVSPYLPLRDFRYTLDRHTCSTRSRLNVERRATSAVDMGFLSLALAAVPLSFSATSTRIHSRRSGHL